MSDEPKNYEISLMLRTEEAHSSVVTFIKEKASQIFSESQVKRVRLAYPIAKEEAGFFSWLVISAVPSIIPALIIDLEKNALVLRVLVITPPLPAKTEGRSNNFRDKSTKVNPRREEIIQAPKEEEHRPRGSETLTNELLEKKLEEILK